MTNLDRFNEAFAHMEHAVMGRRLAKFKDIPHFEIRTGLSLSQKRDKYAASGSVLS